MPNQVPEGFIRYNTSDISIQVSLRYAGSYNFVGDVIDGYYTSEALILTEEAATALFNVQNEVMQDGYSLLVYDAYRPEKAVLRFVEWTEDEDDVETKHIYYPYIDKKDLIPLGYIADKSGHSRGSTIDLTIIKLNTDFLSIPELVYRELSSGKMVPFYNDASIDTGTSFDLFDPVSSYTNQEINSTQFDQRIYLQNKMMKHGFLPYEQEWWHFILENEPFPDTYFDFDIV